jgi:signal transduction histidine kinase
VDEKSTPESKPQRPPLAREFRWQLFARAFVAGFLALTAAVAYERKFLDPTPPTTPLAAFLALQAVCGVIVGYNTVLLFLGRLNIPTARLTLYALILDLFALTSYLHYSGDIENPLMFAYSLPVVAGAVLVSRRAAFLLAGGAALLFLALMISTTIDDSPLVLKHYHLALLRDPHLAAPLRDIDVTKFIDPDTNSQGWNYILAHLLVLVSVLFGSAHGFGMLSERLRGENERLLLLLRILPEGVVLLGKDGSIIHANPAARNLVDGAEGRTVRALDPELGLSERFERFTGTVVEFETSFHDRVYEHALARRIVGEPVVWVFRDTTDHRRLVAQVMHRSKMEDLGLLATGIAHEVGNPLSSMSAILQVMEMKKPPPDIAERLRALDAHVDRIGRIVRDITGFARPSAGERSARDVRALLEKALQIFKMHDKSKEIKVSLDTPQDPVMARVVDDQIVQVLLNLLLNAADASNGQGQVDLSIRQTDKDAVIAVTDHGQGIDAEARRHLFTPFYTTKDQGKGVGLGLFVSESIARAHDGRIDVHSSPGKGSTFTLRLPRQA